MVRALGEIGDADSAILDFLIRAALDEDVDVRYQAAVALRKAGIGESAKQALSNLLNDAHPAVRAAAKLALVNR
jgi:HEAT repeat protein